MSEYQPCIKCGWSMRLVCQVGNFFYDYSNPNCINKYKPEDFKLIIGVELCSLD